MVGSGAGEREKERKSNFGVRELEEEEMRNREELGTKEDFFLVGLNERERERENGRRN